MNKYLALFLVLCLFIIGYASTRLMEIYRPLHAKKIAWKEVFNLKKLDSAYVAQGIEVYKKYILYTVHKQDTASYLIVFKIKKDKNLEYLFKVPFPEIATHVSDLSVYKDFLYAIDYKSNNLYKINLPKMLKSQTLIIDKAFPTNIARSGSIIVTEYDGDDIIYISQFLLNKDIKVYKLDDIGNRDKQPILEIKSKYFIQGLYKHDRNIYISSNKNEIDPIFITNELILHKNKALQNDSTIAIEGPGVMIEDIAIYNDFLFTSDEKTNKIYISKEKISNILKD